MTLTASIMEHHDGAKALPPLTITGLHLGGWAVSDWLTILTIIYVVLQLYVLIRDKILARKAKHGNQDRSD